MQNDREREPHRAITGTSGLLRRVERTGQVASGRFPKFADPRTGEWTWSQDGGWSAGVWPGMLWLAAAATDRALGYKWQ